MTSAVVNVIDNDKNLLKCRILLDTCSTANFVTEELARQLNLPMRTCTLPVGAIDSINTVSKHSMRITFRSMHNDYEKTLTFLTIAKIADAVPCEAFSRGLIKIPKNIRLADPEFHRPKPVDMLIGSGPTLSLFSIGQIKLSHEKYDLCLQKTRLGWVVAGGIDTRNRGLVKCAMTKLESLVEKFWKTEEIIDDESKTKEEIECENHFKQNYTRNKIGRYIVRLPFRKTNAILGDSRGSALRRLITLERKFEKDNLLKDEYVKVINEYLELGHLSLIENPSNNGYYLPHHAVIKQSSTTTRVRVVFDASAKSSTGVSLNDLLMVGPTIQDKIFTHLVRFRSHKYVMTADMEKMYRQVFIHEDDRIFQRILWRHNGEVKTFQLNTVTFGVSSAPFLAIRTVQQLADDENKDFPVASRVLKRDLYVDDLSTGAETIEKARKLRDEIIEVLNRGGFSIRQWASNNERILEGLTNKMLNAKFILDKGSNLKTLGLSWNAREDKIQYSVIPIELKSKITKRNVLSEIAKIFDPLGLLGPVILLAKLIMQDLWKCKLHWDESVPETLHSKWFDFATELNLLNDISFDRHIKIDHCQHIELHGFSDASNKGYGACIYLRTTDEDGNSQCNLICAKSRVAPVKSITKSITTPRLELNGALLLARLSQEVRRVFDFSPGNIILWLKINPSSFKMVEDKPKFI